jgi:hypothetical protein
MVPSDNSLKIFGNDDKTKKTVNGIHGTLFYQLDEKKKFYPNKKEENLTLDRGRKT